MKRSLKLSFCEQVLYKQAISQLCKTEEWNSEYVSATKTAFSIWEPDWRLASFCMSTKDSFYLGKQIPTFHLEHSGVWFLKFFSTEVHVTNSLQLCYTTAGTDTNTPVLLPKHTARAMASPQGDPMLSGGVLSLGSLFLKVRNRLRETHRKLSMPLFLFNEESHVQPDFPRKKSTWSWSLSAERIKNHRHFQLLRIKYSYFIL